MNFAKPGKSYKKFQ